MSCVRRAVGLWVRGYIDVAVRQPPMTYPRDSPLSEEREFRVYGRLPGFHKLWGQITWVSQIVGADYLGLQNAGAEYLGRPKSGAGYLGGQIPSW